MIVSYHVYTLLIFSISSSGWCYLYRSPERCGHSLQVLEVQEGEIQSSTYSSWSYRFGPTNDCWVIKGSEEAPVTISFIEFSTRCKKEWLSIKSSAGGDPLILCGSILPKPIAVPGGNITVMHHFLPHDYPSSKFRLRFSRDSYAGECPLSYFECLGGGCLPFSWRCNGQVECLGEGEGRGTDEEGCVDASVSETLHFGSTGLKSPQNEKEPVLTPAPVKWPCGGLLQTFYGTFSPPAIGESPLYCVWTLDPQDSRPLRLDIQQLVLGRDDTLTVHNREQGRGDVIKIITNAFNYKPVQVESHTGLLSLTYQTLPGSDGSGFNATFHVGSYCPPGEGRCGGSAGGCYIKEQECDGKWDCPETGKDEEGCQGCSVNQFACGMAGQRAAASGHFPGRPLCYPVSERCNYQLYCADGSDERDCTVCQKGTFHCDSDRCVFESWRCDGQKDCKDGTDELNCAVTLPRKVITAATVGSLVCGLLLVIAMGCTCKLYSLRTREYSLFAPISRHEAELIQQQAPPSYGQLIAQGVIPPVEDFPTENPNETSSLSLRGILQLLRQDAVNSPHRRRRPRFIRRAVRRMRRWGLIPRPPTRSSQTANSSQQQTDRAPPVQEQPCSPTAGSSSAVEAVNQPVPQKLGLLVQSAQQHQHETPSGSSLVVATPVVSPPPPPYAPPAPPEAASNTPPVAVPPSSPSLASIFHTLGLSISLFRASSTNSMLLSASPSFSSSSSDDDVLLIPLSEDTTSEDDVPMLT